MEQVLYKKKYRVTEGYRIFVDAFRTLSYFKQAKKQNLLSKTFIKRIMLAVTEVNGCEVCTYEHTKTALEMGMSETEIHHLLTGQNSELPIEESKAIFFAQHYADTKGQPSEDAWQEIEAYYGKDKSLSILGAIRVIMFGNSFGIAFSALKSRWKGAPVESSSLGYELAMLTSLLIIIPVGIIHGLIENLMNKKVLTFQ